MSTVEIKADKVIVATKHALVDAEQYLSTLTKGPYSGRMGVYNHIARVSAQGAVYDLQCLLTAAQACEGVITMDMDDVGRISKWL